MTSWVFIGSVGSDFTTLGSSSKGSWHTLTGGANGDFALNPIADPAAIGYTIILLDTTIMWNP